MHVFKKKMTVLVFPEGLANVRKFQVLRGLPTLGVILCLVCIAALGAYSYHTHTQLKAYQNQESELNRLRQKAAQQDVEIYSFADKLHQLEMEMVRLQQFDRKIRAMTGVTPTLEEDPDGGRGGSEWSIRDENAVLRGNVKNRVNHLHEDMARLLFEMSVHEQTQHELCKLLEDNKSLLSAMPSVWPLKGPITSYFGYRPNPFGGRSAEFHRGLDIGAPNGQPILSPADGVVVSTEWNSGYGRILTISHGYGLVTRYAHLSEYYVEEGQRVKRGQKIAAVGSSGRVTGPHLHWETILNGVPVNPLKYLTAKN
jgi:murein DD-endopeptidase MepM/ murein hydrolase activator NlpD